MHKQLKCISFFQDLPHAAFSRNIEYIPKYWGGIWERGRELIVCFTHFKHSKDEHVVQCITNNL